MPADVAKIDESKVIPPHSAGTALWHARAVLAAGGGSAPPFKPVVRIVWAVNLSARNTIAPIKPVLALNKAITIPGGKAFWLTQSDEKAA